MSEQFTNDSMLDMFIFETSQLVEQLEESILTSEKTSQFTQDSINEIFRIMHTIKGSSAMMMFNGISALAHSIEDLFYFLREEQPKNVDCSALSDIVLEGVDFIKVETEKIKKGESADGTASGLSKKINEFLSVLKNENNSVCSLDFLIDTKKPKFNTDKNKSETCEYKNVFKAVVHFKEDCEMENIRAYAIIHNLQNITNQIYYIPDDIQENDGSTEIIKRDGFKIYFKTEYDYAEMGDFFMQTIFLKDLELVQLQNDDELKQFAVKEKNLIMRKDAEVITSPNQYGASSLRQSIISVSVAKLDTLLNIVGEMVISEAMVIQNPELKGLELDSFHKAARQLKKITDEIQDVVMSIRMLPLSITFHKMNRIVRDMCKKLDKEVRLEIIGEETEFDKNIIEHISDPLMHLVRNAVDHGIETDEERIVKGKPQDGTVTLQAKNAGSDVLITVKDDGKGLKKEKILKKARENGLLYKSEAEMTDQEIFNLIFLPGLSTNDNVTEFSGRGVGMDVVAKNIEAVGGSVSVESIPNEGTAITLKIPLTLAIIDGMNIKVGNSRYTIPTISIKESFRPKENEVFGDPDGNEMIMVRGECYKILRLYEVYKVQTDITNIPDGILIMVEQDNKTLCLFADQLLGQQQVVVKTLPEYIRKFKKITGLAGCTLLGDGSISLIMDIGGLIRL